MILDDRHHEYVDVEGRDVANCTQLNRAFGLEGAVHSVYWDHTLKSDRAELPWPFWFEGQLLKGKIVTGETVYEAPCKFAIPAVQHFCIIRPITFTGKLRVKWGGNLRKPT